MRTFLAYIFTLLASRAIAARTAAGAAGGRLARSAIWFRELAQKITYVSPTKLLSDKENEAVPRMDSTIIGSMVFYFYDPKHKDTLPYYDKFPLVFVSEIYPDGWAGINVHYLPPFLRAKLMDALYKTAEGKGTDKMKLHISYNILKSISKMTHFKPCYKRYLANHIRSNVVKVKPNNWDMALMLPTQRFAKKSASYVWAESQKSVG